MDVFWDGWFNSFKMFQSMQNGVEQKSLQAFESQKEWIQSISDQLSQLEEDSKTLLEEWKENLQNIMNSIKKEFGVQNSSEWVDKFGELGIKAETLAFTPSKVSFELLSKSYAQLETTLKEALNQQKKS